MTDDRLTTLRGRVAQGLTWLAEHDPTGAFHFWYEAGLTPRSPMPAQDEDRRADWTAWHQARRLWGELDRQLQKIDPQWKESR